MVMQFNIRKPRYLNLIDFIGHNKISEPSRKKYLWHQENHSVHICSFQPDNSTFFQ